VREADHSPQYIAEVKNGGGIPPLPNISSDIMPDEVSRGINLYINIRTNEPRHCNTYHYGTHENLL
jgi:hypothetical protein